MRAEEEEATGAGRGANGGARGGANGSTLIACINFILTIF